MTTKTLSFTRATTVASTLSDRYGLEKWAQRNLILGIAARPDLYALAASYTPDDKDALNRLADDAQEAAKSRSGANLGTALHRILERIDSGEDLDVPDSWKPDVDAYCQALVDAHIKILPEYMERVVVVPKAKIAGTLDRLVAIDGATYVADIKTAQDVVTYGMGEIAIQLAIYANASLMWRQSVNDVKRDRWGRYSLPSPTEAPDEFEPMPDVNKDRALVIHLPAGQGECHLHWVDIRAGAEAVKQALWVREWRKRKGLSQPLDVGVTARNVEEVMTAAATADDDW